MRDCFDEKPTPPRKLYRYTSTTLPKLLSLLNNELYFSKLLDFNDPFEGQMLFGNNPYLKKILISAVQESNKAFYGNYVSESDRSLAEHSIECSPVGLDADEVIYADEDIGAALRRHYQNDTIVRSHLIELGREDKIVGKL